MSEPLQLSTLGNWVLIGGGIAISDFRRILAAIYNLIHTRRYPDIHLDFSQCTFVHSPPMVALICCCMKHQDEGVDFDVTLPIDDGLKRLFLNSNWANLIAPKVYPKSTYGAIKHNPASQYKSPEEQANLVNDVINTILSNFHGFSRSHLKAIEWSLNEITDNVLNHAQSASGGVIQVTAQRTRKRVEFVVGDAGIGIADSLRASHREITSDVDALARAIQEGVTRDKSVGQGNGLFGSYRLAVESKGNFSINANHATLYYADSTGMHSKSEVVPVSGSVVTCCIDYSNPLLLDKALRFSDKPHNPVDLVEIRYESGDDGILVFPLAGETPSVGSRIAGTRVRTKLLNLINVSPDRQLIVDFSGIRIISSSFADEVFGKLFVELGPIVFAGRFGFRHIDPTVKMLIDKAILQRASVGLSQ